MMDFWVISTQIYGHFNKKKHAPSMDLWLSLAILFSGKATWSALESQTLVIWKALMAMNWGTSGKLQVPIDQQYRISFGPVFWISTCQFSRDQFLNWLNWLLWTPMPSDAHGYRRLKVVNWNCFTPLPAAAMQSIASFAARAFLRSRPAKVDQSGMDSPTDLRMVQQIEMISVWVYMNLYQSTSTELLYVFYIWLLL